MMDKISEIANFGRQPCTEDKKQVINMFYCLDKIGENWQKRSPKMYVHSISTENLGIN